MSYYVREDCASVNRDGEVPKKEVHLAKSNAGQGREGSSSSLQQSPGRLKAADTHGVKLPVAGCRVNTWRQRLMSLRFSSA